MNLKKLYEYRLLIILAMIVVAMSIVKIKYRNVDWDKVSGLITPTVIPTSAPQINEDYPLWELLPYAGNGFVVDRYVEPKMLAIKTGSIDEEFVTQEIYGWMRENKVATESHQLVFEKEN